MNIKEVRKLTIGQRLLLSLNKYKKGVSWRRLSSWHQRFKYNSVYQTIYKLRRDGLVQKKGKYFFITEAGIAKLKEAHLIKEKSNEPS